MAPSLVGFGNGSPGGNGYQVTANTDQGNNNSRQTFLHTCTFFLKELNDQQ